MREINNATPFPHEWGTIKSMEHLALRLVTHPTAQILPCVLGSRRFPQAHRPPPPPQQRPPLQALQCRPEPRRRLVLRHRRLLLLSRRHCRHPSCRCWTPPTHTRSRGGPVRTRVASSMLSGGHRRESRPAPWNRCTFPSFASRKISRPVPSTWSATLRIGWWESSATTVAPRTQDTMCLTCTV